MSNELFDGGEILEPLYQPPPRTMLAIATCAKCGLQARYSGMGDNSGMLEFDAAQFRADCLISANSQNFECSELVEALKSAVVEPT